MSYDRPLVLVTGGSRGIGRHLARGFAAAGYPVALTATSAAKAHKAALEIVASLSEEGRSAQVAGFGVDVADAASVERLKADVLNYTRSVDTDLGVLVNNAGRIESTEGPVWDVPAADVAAVIGANVLGPILMIRAFAPVLMDTAAASGSPSRIIDLNSGSGAVGTKPYGVYSASKAALFRIADAVVEFGQSEGLRIFELAPGVVRTEMTASMPMHDSRAEDAWTTPVELVDLALGLAGGRLDAYTGRYVRAGTDTVESLLAEAPDLGTDTRRLVLGD